ncbi:hypothetical protein ACFOET_10625 [Parapedobacter deserti]|uniref:Uncharacterized protein n=1 Tax=Parapedobacter deserti TaxID=1912957 RepID=A0ABV7JJ16_9SPHI
MVKVGDQVLSGKLDDGATADTEMFLNQAANVNINDGYQLWVVRNEKKIKVDGSIIPNARYDVFKKAEKVSSEQEKLRARWMSN